MVDTPALVSVNPLIDYKFTQPPYDPIKSKTVNVQAVRRQQQKLK